MEEHETHFLIRAAMLIRSRPETLYQEIHAVKTNPFDCMLVYFKQKSKGRHAKNTNGSRKNSAQSSKHARGAMDPWLLATSLPVTGTLAKKVVAVYK